VLRCRTFNNVHQKLFRFFDHLHAEQVRRFPQFRGGIPRNVAGQLFDSRRCVLEADSDQLSDVLPIDGNPEAAAGAGNDEVLDGLHGRQEPVHLVAVVMVIVTACRRL